MLRRVLSIIVLFIFTYVLLPFGIGWDYIVTMHIAEAEQVVLLDGHTGIFETEQAFSSFAFSWSGTSDAHISYRSVYSDGTMGMWYEIHADDHGEDLETATRFFSPMLFTDRTSQIEYHIETGGQLEHFEMITYPVSKQLAISPAHAALAAGQIVSRSEWGADDSKLYLDNYLAEREALCSSKPWYCGTSSAAAQEAVRKKAQQVKEAYPYDTTIAERHTHINGKEVLWDVDISDHISKIFVHHTASVNKDQNGDGVITRTDEEITLRGIYQFHTITRGWGDIGYNYIIGPSGTIYEGRYGGPKAVAAHAVWRNISSVGISLMGNFQEETMTNAQKESLSVLIASVAKANGFSPTDNTTFYGRTLPAVMGHKDSAEAATSCPGTSLYDALPSIRTLASSQFNKNNIIALQDSLERVTHPAYAGTVSIDNSSSFTAGETKTLQISVKNTGNITWDADRYLELSGDAKSLFTIEQVTSLSEGASAIVAPGDTAHFEVTLTAPFKKTSGTLTVTPIIDNKYLIAEKNAQLSVTGGLASFAIDNLSLHSGVIGQKAEGSLKLKNTGDVVFQNSGSHAFTIDLVGTTNHKDYTTFATLPLPKDVVPGAELTIPFSITLPTYPGTLFFSASPTMAQNNLLVGSPGHAEAAISSISKLALSLPTSTLAADQRTVDVVVTNNNTFSLSLDHYFPFQLKLTNADQDLIIPLQMKATLAPGAKQTVAIDLPAYINTKEQSTLKLSLYNSDVSDATTLSFKQSLIPTATASTYQEETASFLDDTYLPLRFTIPEQYVGKTTDLSIYTEDTILRSKIWESEEFVMSFSDLLKADETYTIPLFVGNPIRTTYRFELRDRVTGEVISKSHVKLAPTLRRKPIELEFGTQL